MVSCRPKKSGFGTKLFTLVRQTNVGSKREAGFGAPRAACGHSIGAPV